MGKVSLEQLRDRFKKIGERRELYDVKAKSQNGMLTRSDNWRYEYFENPYLLGAPDERLLERFNHTMLNVVEIGLNGKIRTVDILQSDEFIRAFAHIQEEYWLRGMTLPAGLDIAATKDRMQKYFETGEPLGVTLFKNYQTPTTPIIVKYGKREHLEPMLKFGRLRLSNANSYNKPGLNDAMRDDETSRTLFIPTFKERIAGQTHLKMGEKRFKILDDDIELPILFDDYYLLSLCEQIHYRMPTDFESDSALVIREPIRFQQKLISTFLAQFPDWLPSYGKVSYYDPYRDLPDLRAPQMSKHFAYAYQKEVRFVFRPHRKSSAPLKPVFLSIGPMASYADLVTL